MMKSITLLFYSLLLAAMAQGQIVHVPADYPTIQQGINAATPGDTVLVSTGTYYEQINFLGKKPLIVASEFLIDGDTNHITNTIINGSQPQNSDSASVVYFVSGEDTTSVLCGFTITGGKGTTRYSPEAGWAKEGGGIWISGSGAKILNNNITHNRCVDINLPNIQFTFGGGIASARDQDNYWIVIENNVIDSNYVISDSTAGLCTGGGISIWNNCRIINNIIKNNVGRILVNTIYWSQGTGAGIFTLDTSLHKVAIIQKNLFFNNSNNANNALGGGMKIMNMHITCSNNTFKGNRVESDISIQDCWGAGMEAGNFLEGSVISNNAFIGNYSESTDAGLMIFSQDPSFATVVVENNYFVNNTAEGLGGAFGSYDCPAILQNNVFSGNHAGIRGGALFLSRSTGPDSEHLVTLINNSFFSNTATIGGGAIYSVLAKPLIFNSIFWNDSAINGQEIFSTAAIDTIEIAYSNINPSTIQGGCFIDGIGNIYEDPLFTDLELQIDSVASPCINAGTEEYYCFCGHLHSPPAYDILGNLRPLNDYFEMGAYEVLLTGINSPIAKKFTDWHSVYPNPFNDQTKISYELDRKTQVDISLYNINGEQIQTLLSERQEAGNHELQFSPGNLPAGIYFYRITTGSKQATGRMILMK